MHYPSISKLCNSGWLPTTDRWNWQMTLFDTQQSESIGHYFEFSYPDRRPLNKFIRKISRSSSQSKVQVGDEMCTFLFCEITFRHHIDDGNSDPCGQRYHNMMKWKQTVDKHTSTRWSSNLFVVVVVVCHHHQLQLFSSFHYGLKMPMCEFGTFKFMRQCLVTWVVVVVVVFILTTRRRWLIVSVAIVVGC